MWCLWLATSVALAQQTNPEPPPVDLEGAEELPAISEEQHDFLRPKRHLLPENPYAQVDYTAYVLEWGEMQLGLTGIEFGLVPQVQIGTNPFLDLIGLYNGHLKIAPFRLGRVELGATGQMFRVSLGDFSGTLLAGGPMTSIIVARGLSIHGGAQWGFIYAAGIPDRLPPLVESFGLVSQDELSATADQLRDLGVDPVVQGSAMLARFAMDYRFNRRDSIILQFVTMPWGNYSSNLGDDLDPVMADMVGLVVPWASTDSYQTDGQLDMAQAWAVTLSWQFAWQQLGLRLGGGLSPKPLAWIMQGNDLHYRFGGPTRRDDRRRKRGWRNTEVGDEPDDG